MKRWIVPIAAVMLCTCSFVAAGEQKLLRVHVGDALPNVAHKFNTRRDVTIVFLGGTLSSGGGERGYVEQVRRWLQARYPRVEPHVINAGIPGSDSEFAAVRVQRDVIRHKPDLVFIDFAAEDGNTDATLNLERVVRQIWTADPSIDIVVLYALRAEHVKDWYLNQLPLEVLRQERVGVHYRIPSIAMAIEPVELISSKKVRWEALFRDEFRPTPEGYRIYTQQITTALKKLLSQAQELPHELPEPLRRESVPPIPAAVAVPLPAPAPLVTRAGQTAKVTYELPIFGVHWIGGPEFKYYGETLWRLQTRSAVETGKRLNDLIGLDRSWDLKPMQWLDEWRFFHGAAGVPLAYSKDRTSGELFIRNDDLPVLSFITPQSGRYAVSIKSGPVTLWGLHEALAMNVVHFSGKASKGKSLAFHRTDLGVERGLDLEFEVILEKGDELAMCLDSNAASGGGGAGFRNLQVRIGCLENK